MIQFHRSNVTMAFLLQYERNFSRLLREGTTCHCSRNISMRIQLYEFANVSYYNARSISTLSNESFFSDLTCLDRESHSYPKACNIPHVMGQVVTLNYFKHKPYKSFCLKPTLKAVYPVHVLNEEGN